MKKQHITLSEADRTYLEKLISQGELAAKIYKRALGLLELGRGKPYSEVAKTLSVHQVTVSKWAHKYKVQGLSCLQDKPRAGRPIEIDGQQRAKVTALACSQAPEGYGRWSLRLLAEKAVELGYCEHISHTSVKEVLKKTTSSPT
jgi:transposase